jgi:hypothetical protein
MDHRLSVHHVTPASCLLLRKKSAWEPDDLSSLSSEESKVGHGTSCTMYVPMLRCVEQVLAGGSSMRERLPILTYIHSVDRSEGFMQDSANGVVDQHMHEVLTTVHIYEDVWYVPNCTEVS